MAFIRANWKKLFQCLAVLLNVAVWFWLLFSFGTRIFLGPLRIYEHMVSGLVSGKISLLASCLYGLGFVLGLNVCMLFSSVLLSCFRSEKWIYAAGVLWGILFVAGGVYPWTAGGFSAGTFLVRLWWTWAFAAGGAIGIVGMMLSAYEARKYWK